MCASNCSSSSSRIRYERLAGAPPSSLRWCTSSTGVGGRTDTGAYASPCMGGERPLVSIVTPSYNQARFLGETIRSVLDQDYPAVEYIVVDDGSSDDSVEIIRRYEDRLAWWTAQPNAGQVAAINRGFEHATGKLMGFLNSDDTLLPG